MDFVDRLSALARGVEQKIDHVSGNEEATKTALVLPFFNVLGYDVFDPTVVRPEYTADIGVKKNEKVDYSILDEDGKPVIVIECKAACASLNAVAVSQLARYFATTEARFGVLTNGKEYCFFSDVEDINKMDMTPFFRFDMLHHSPEDVKHLKRFSCDSFDIRANVLLAENLKYMTAIKETIAEQTRNPHEDFVKFILSMVYKGPKTRVRIEKFTPLTRNAFREFINDRISERLQSALESGDDTEQEPKPEPEPEPEPAGDGIITTEAEIRAHEIVRDIASKVIDGSRVTMFDRKHWCNLTLDGSQRGALLCRISDAPGARYRIMIPNNTRGEVVARYGKSPVIVVCVDSVEDIYGFSDDIIERITALEAL